MFGAFSIGLGGRRKNAGKIGGFEVRGRALLHDGTKKLVGGGKSRGGRHQGKKLK